MERKKAGQRMHHNKTRKAAVQKIRQLVQARPLGGPYRPNNSALSQEAREALQALREERRLTREKLDRAASI